MLWGISKEDITQVVTNKKEMYWLVQQEISLEAGWWQWFGEYQGSSSLHAVLSLQNAGFILVLISLCVCRWRLLAIKGTYILFMSISHLGGKERRKCFQKLYQNSVENSSRNLQQNFSRGSSIQVTSYAHS